MGKAATTQKTAHLTLLDAMQDKALFGPWFQGKSWAAWKAFLAALFGLPVHKATLEIYRQHTGRTSAPDSPVREAWLVVGRRGGKSLVSALVAVFLACFRDYRKILAPGERGTVMVIAADRRQARGVFHYIAGFLDAVPMLTRMVESRTKETINLTNRVTIEVHTANFRAVRGYTVIAAICDEIAFWRSEESANPDTEILNGLRPGMATVPGALLLCISSPYARRGALWEAYRRHYSQDGDPILVWQADTRSMNPSVDEQVIAEAYAQDEAAAAAEYGAQFRRDIQDFIPHEVPGVSGCRRPALAASRFGLALLGLLRPIGRQPGQHDAGDRPPGERSFPAGPCAGTAPAFLPRGGGEGVFRNPEAVRRQLGDRRSLRGRMAPGAFPGTRHLLRARTEDQE